MIQISDTVSVIQTNFYSYLSNLKSYTTNFYLLLKRLSVATILLQKMNTIVLAKWDDGEQKKIRLVFEHNRKTVRLVKKIAGIGYDRSNRCWYLPNNKAIIRETYRLLWDKLYIQHFQLFDEKKPRESGQKLVKNIDPCAMDSLRSFKMYLQENYDRKHTIICYMNMVEVFFTFFTYEESKTLGENDISNLNILLEQKYQYAKSSIAQFNTVVKTFYRFMGWELQ